MTIQITGVEDVQTILDDLIPRHARNIMRATIHGIAQTISKDAKLNAPVDTGNLKRAIKAKRKRSHPDNPISEVIVTTGKNQKNDAFYWRFVEYGTAGENPQSERPFIRPASDKARVNFKKTLAEEFGKKLEAAAIRESKKRAKK